MGTYSCQISKRSGMPMFFLCLVALMGMLIFGVMALDPSSNIPLNKHAIERHAEAEEVRQAVLSCKPDQLREYKGIGQYDGRTMWGCMFKDFRKVAFWIVVGEEMAADRTVTAFVSKSWEYADSLIKQGKYILEVAK